MQLSRPHHHPLRWLPLMALAFAPLAQAHHLPPGFEEVDEFATHGAARALLHPFTGIDHMLVALGVGWMAWTLGRKLGGGLVTAFLGSLMLGVVAGHAGGVSLPDGAMALSVAAIGFFLAPSSARLNGIRFSAVVAAGLVQGMLHAGMAPASLSGLFWALAMASGTAVLCATGYGMAQVTSRRTPAMGRWAAAALVIAGAAQWMMF